jgi:PKD repeat protein
VDRVLVSFQYRRVDDITWKNTPAYHYTASGDHIETLSNLLPDTNYEFRAWLVFGDIQVLGDSHRFKTEDTLAFFIGTPTVGITPLTVTFTAATGSPATYQWDFGDNETSTLQNPEHTYTETGFYTVTLTVTQGTESDSLTRNSYIRVWKDQIYAPLILYND